MAMPHFEFFWLAQFSENNAFDIRVYLGYMVNSSRGLQLKSNVVLGLLQRFQSVSLDQEHRILS
jgi:hypothetical protein